MSGDPEAMKILIVDDEAPARIRIRELLDDCAVDLRSTVVGEATNGLDAIAVLEKTPVDVVLLDIRMPEMDGIELAAHLQKFPIPPAVIFTTAYDDYALSAFEVNAIDYLLKPIRAERLLAALKKARALTVESTQALREAIDKPRSHLSVYERGRILLVPLVEIVYLKAELKYVTIRTAEREYLLEESLTRLEQEFVHTFVRVHRNCLVAKDYITGFERTEQENNEGEPHAGWAVLLKGMTEKLPISRRQYAVVKNYKK
jgi:two-component system response regulator AlgR